MLLASVLLSGLIPARASTTSTDASEFVIASGSQPMLHGSIPSSWVVNSAQIAFLLTAGQVQITNFPGSETDLVTLDLKRAHSPIDSTTEFWEGSSIGAQRISVPAFVAFRGKVHGEPNSRVVLTSFAGKLLVSITRESGLSYVFGPAKNSENPAEHLFTRETDLFAYGQYHALNCIADDIPQPNALVPSHELLDQYAAGMGRSKTLGEPNHTQLLQVDIAVEADSCFYHAAGGQMNLVLGYIASLFAMSSTIYEDEVNITWHIPWVKVWPSGDPYNVAGNAYALEDTVPIYWRAHYANVSRDCAHVLTSIGYGGGGYGYLSMCDTEWSYSMSSPQTGHTYPTFAFTYDAYIVAHEVGHNFSLVHSHCCYWDPPLDTCYTTDDTVHGLKIADACESLPITPKPNPGSIMSYCANANYALSGNNFSDYKLAMTFTPKVDSVLRVNAEKAACIVPPTNPTLILLSPRGSETYPGDTTITLQWAYANLDSVSLEYSPTGTAPWLPIAQSIPASQGELAWQLPNVSSSNMLLRVIDAANTQLADTSLLFFTVLPQATVQSSVQGSEFRLSPDPAQNELIVTGVVSGQRTSYTIADVNGVVIRSSDATADGNASINIDLSGLATGTYFLRMTYPIARVYSFIHTK